MEKNNTGSAMTVRKKRIVFAAVAVCLLLTAVIVYIITARAAADRQKQRREIAGIFEEYQKYGLIYNEKENRLYYNDDPVRYFEDIVDDDHYMKWPGKDGAVDVYAVRDASGELDGVKPFGQQEFKDRTPELQNEIYELQITVSETVSIDGYTDEVEEQVKDRIEDAYLIYSEYGLTYDRESDHLYYKGELVGYFEDKELNHSFGPYEDSHIKIYAVRDNRGKLTGLDVNGSEER